MENTVWAPFKHQARNKRNNRLITYQGRTQCLTDWAEELGIGVHTLLHRLGKLGWSVEDAFTTPVQRQARKYASEAITFNGKTQRLSEWARELGIGYRLLRG